MLQPQPAPPPESLCRENAYILSSFGNNPASALLECNQHCSLIRLRHQDDSRHKCHHAAKASRTAEAPRDPAEGAVVQAVDARLPAG